MSAIFGHMDLRGAPVPVEVGTTMGSAMTRWGAVSLQTVTGGVLGMANRPITPEAVFEDMPIQIAESGLAFTAAARLDNRDDLCDFFGIPLVERSNLPDGRLVVLAHLRWGEDAPLHLFGDWAYAAWDSVRRTLFLARDQLGNTGLYFHLSTTRVTFATDPEALFTLPEISRKIHEGRLAAILIHRPFKGMDTTQWEGIRKVPHGHCSSFSYGAETSRAYWNIECVPPTHFRNDEACLEAFLEQYTAAVQVRLRSRLPIGTTLSAGLDSSSVTALAAECLAREGRPLTAFTSVLLNPCPDPVGGGRLLDEWPMAHAVALGLPNTEHLAVRAEEVSPLTGLRMGMDVMHTHMMAGGNLYWIMAMLAMARERNLGVILTGQAGNGSVSWSGEYQRIFRLFTTGRWDEGRRAMTQWKQHHGRSWIRTLASQLLKPALAPILGRSMASGDGLAPGPINASFAARHPYLARDLDGYRPGWPNSPHQERVRAIRGPVSLSAPVWQALGAGFGLEFRDPTADLRLLDFCLRVPDAVYAHGGGDRMLLRRAMDGRLPSAVCWNQLIGKQSADLLDRLRLHREEMELVLARLDSNAIVARYLEVGGLKREWCNLDQGPGNDFNGASRLLQWILCAIFIEDASRLGIS